MPLTLGGAPYTDWEALLPLAKQLGWSAQEAPADISALLKGTLSERVDDNLHVLVHSRPERAVARALQQEEAPEEAFAKWLQSARDLLDFYHGSPEQAIVIEAEAAVRHPEALLAWLEKNRPEFIQSEVKEAPSTGGATVDDGSLNTLFLVIAAQTVAQHPEALLVLDELEAVSIPLGEAAFRPPALDMNQLVNDLSQERTSSNSLVEKLQADQNDQKQQLQKENDLLLLQLHKTQEELEQMFYELKELKQHAEVGQQQNVTAGAHPQALSKTEQENELLLMQLHNVQEELERYYLKSKGLSGEIGSKNRRIKELNRKKDALSKENGKLKNTRRRLIYELHQKNVLLYRSSLKARILSALRFPLRVLRKFSPAKRQIPAQLKMVNQSDLFDPQWYLEKNPDIQMSNIDPLVHFVLHGGQEGRSPSMWFSSEWYLNKYKDVADAGLNPLVHYLMSGKDEGRQISPGKKLMRNK